MVLVTIFICIPFTIRELVPVLEEIGLEEEDAARTLGASIWQTFFRVTFPNIRWALGYGVALTVARAIGEIGAVLIVSGLIKGKTETATIYIFTRARGAAGRAGVRGRPRSGGDLRGAARRRSKGSGGARNEEGSTLMSTPIVVEQLTKRFGDFAAVTDVTFTAPAGRDHRAARADRVRARARCCG